MMFTFRATLACQTRQILSVPHKDANTIRVIRLPRDQDLKIITEADEATVEHPVCRS
jgi:hypothetical protein